MELDDYIGEITATGNVARDFKFCDQIRASAGGPAPHIAEGFGRFTPREFVRYLRIAISSLQETQTHLERGLHKKYFDQDVYVAASRLCGRALNITTRLLASKLRQIADDEQKKKDRRQKQRSDQR